ncbi:hypothetical protein QW71_26155 [Paenibacillus sp. IHB B 3415]|nr:hypothetical protein QW71_26155 [Paenibacillus sp. IHB B 3415]
MLVGAAGCCDDDDLAGARPGETLILLKEHSNWNNGPFVERSPASLSMAYSKNEGCLNQPFHGF